MIWRRLHGSSLAAAIGAALLLKALILYGLWRAFFAHPQAVHMRMPSEQVAAHLLAGAAPAAVSPNNTPPTKVNDESH